MIGALNAQHPEAQIIGGGIAGLMAAHRLLEQGWRVDVFEAGPRAGGLIASTAHPLGLVEHAAHSFRTAPDILALCARLGVPVAVGRTRKKYILRAGALRRFPLRIGEAVEALARALFVPARSDTHSLAEFAEYHLGHAAVQHLFAPLAHGIYAAAAEELLVDTTFPTLRPPVGRALLPHLLRQAVGRRGPRPEMAAPKGGMGALTQALTDYVQNHAQGRLFLNSAVESLPDGPNLLLCTPAGVAARLLTRDAPQAARALAQVRYAPLITATVFVRAAQLAVPEGIGLLVSGADDRPTLGILFNSAALDERVTRPSLVSLSVMLGGTRRPELLGLDDARLTALVRQELAALLGLRGAVEDIIITRWAQAIPVYDAALRSALEAVRAEWAVRPGRVLFGNYTGEVSLRGLCGSLSRFAGPAA